MKIKLVSLLVNDPIEAHKFYTETLGFISRQYIPEAWLAIVASPEEPEGTGMLLEPNHNPISKDFAQRVYKAGLPVIIFGVDDIDKEYERLKNAGVTFRKGPTKTQWGTEAIFEDTCGNLIQIHQS